MPSLKPLTAPPRSVPRLRSFFVPKIRMTTSKTISQCQMLNEPMCVCSQVSRGERSAARLLFLYAGSAFAARELGEHFLRTRAMPGEQDHAVKPEIGGFAYEMQFITVLRGKQGLRRLLRDLLEDRVV